MNTLRMLRKSGPAKGHSHPQWPRSKHQESQPLAGFDFLNMRREFVSYSQLIRFARLDSEHAQSDGKSVNRGLRALDFP